MAKNTKFVIISLAVIIILVIGGLVFTRFMNFKNKGLAGLQKLPQPSVVITSPQPFSQGSVHYPTSVNVTAHSYQPIKSLQLWVNGALMGEQDVIPSNTLAYNTIFDWQSGGAGKYSLVARVIDQTGNTADSPVVLVEILAYTPPPGTTGSVSFDPGKPLVEPQAPPGAAPAPSPAPGETSGPGTSSGLSFADFLANLAVNTPPNAPGLVSIVQACSVNLEIHDLSNNEAGFQIFRSENGGIWDQIATLNSQSKYDWITYTDTLTGTTQASYYVLAVNSAGHSESNPVSVNIDQASCSSANGNQQVVDINLQSFDTGGAADRSYCYRSFDDIHWDRWPSTGFLTSSGSPLDPSKTRMAFNTVGPDGKSEPANLVMSLECWGWNGSNLKYLGKVHFSNPDLSLAGIHSASDGILHIIFNTGSGGKVPFGYTQPPKDKNMPFIDAWLTYDPNFCKNHQPPNAPSDVCAPFPGYSTGLHTANPQPYLVWFVLEHTCPAGFNNKCATIADLENDAKTSGGQLYFLLHQEDKLTGDDYGVPIGQTVYVAPMANCPGDFTDTITLQYIAPGDFAQSAESNQVTIPCAQPFGNKLPISVTFNSMTLNNLGDGTVDLYGVFQASTPSGSNLLLNLGQSDSSIRSNDGCPGDAPFGSFNTNGLAGLGCLDTYGSGTTSLAAHEMCLADIGWLCYISSTNTNTNYMLNNNTFKLSVAEGDSIKLHIEVWDYDTIAADDLICASNSQTPSRTLLQWANSVPQTFNMSNPDLGDGDGSCSVQVTIQVAH